MITISILFSTETLFSQNEVITELQALQPFIEKTWKGEFANSTPENPKQDISRWERALNGTAIRILHSVNNGEKEDPNAKVIFK